MHVASTNGVALTANNSTAALAANAEPACAVLVLPIGRSAVQRLTEIAQVEGLDLISTATMLLAFQTGAYVAARRAQRTDPDPPPTAVAHRCMMCGRPRVRARDRKCGHCGGSWAVGLD